MIAPAPPPTVIVLRLRLPPGPAGIRALRFALKAMLRRLGLKCIELREEVTSGQRKSVGNQQVLPRVVT
jgi:hypothetical protein